VWVEQTRDRGRLKAFLERDRGWAAYALGDLDPGMFEQTDWFLAGYADTGIQPVTASSLCLVFHGLTPSPLLCMGDPAGVSAILDVLDETRPFLNMRREYLPAVETRYRFGDLVPMWRMVLPPGDFHPIDGPVVRLTMAHLAEVQRIYALTFGGDAFAPFQLRDGVYFGIFDANRLASVAGTHLVGSTYSVAAVGNVATLPDYRNRGYAQATNSAVCAELLRQGIKTIVLNVSQANAPAIRAYRKLGFKVHCEFLEGPAERRT
jgi:GNAT superfamily N-acetyltransferase